MQAKAEQQAEDKLVTALVGEGAGGDTRAKFRRMLRDGELEDKEVDVHVAETGASPLGAMDIPGMPPGQMINLGEMMKGMMGQRQKAKRMTVAAARVALTRDEADQLLDTEQVTKDAVVHAEQNGIVFLDEIDKVCARSSEGGFRGGDVSREGVQRDLLPLIEGTTVSTKYGPVKTDHVLFIASGAFHLAKPSDLLPELQGRLPIRVELAPLSRADLRRILVEPEHSLLKQYTALMRHRGGDARIPRGRDRRAGRPRRRHQRPGGEHRRPAARHRDGEGCWRRSASPPATGGGETVSVDAAYVNERVAPLATKGDLQPLHPLTELACPARAAFGSAERRQTAGPAAGTRSRRVQPAPAAALRGSSSGSRTRRVTTCSRSCQQNAISSGPMRVRVGQEARRGRAAEQQTVPRFEVGAEQQQASAAPRTPRRSLASSRVLPSARRNCASSTRASTVGDPPALVQQVRRLGLARVPAAFQGELAYRVYAADSGARLAFMDT